jgi:hypothetical protein
MNLALNNFTYWPYVAPWEVKFVENFDFVSLRSARFSNFFYFKRCFRKTHVLYLSFTNIFVNYFCYKLPRNN